MMAIGLNFERQKTDFATFYFYFYNKVGKSNIVDQITYAKKVIKRTHFLN